MRNSQRGFIVPLLLTIIAILLAGGAYVYTQPKQGSQTATENPSVATPTPSDQKTYSSTKYGFEFTFPTTWMISETANGLTLTPASEDANAITLTVSSLQEGTPSITCPLSTHEVECKNIENTHNVRYAREITAGQSTAQTYQERTLSGHILTAKESIVIQALLTDASGKTHPATESVFDMLMQSITFIEQTAASAAPINNQTIGWKTYTSNELGISFSYPDNNTINTELLKTVSGDTGKMFGGRIMTFDTRIDSSATGKEIDLAATTKDYSSAKEGSNFGTEGFEAKGEKYYMIMNGKVSGTPFVPDEIWKLENGSNVPVMYGKKYVIYGENYDAYVDGFPEPYASAIVNISSQNFTGIKFVLWNIDKTGTHPATPVDIAMFKKIVTSVHFIK